MTFLKLTWMKMVWVSYNNGRQHFLRIYRRYSKYFICINSFNTYNNPWSEYSFYPSFTDEENEHRSLILAQNFRPWMSSSLASDIFIFKRKKKRYTHTWRKKEREKEYMCVFCIYAYICLLKFSVFVA